jgi:hypothetical protein
VPSVGKGSPACGSCAVRPCRAIERLADAVDCRSVMEASDGSEPGAPNEQTRGSGVVGGGVIGFAVGAAVYLLTATR